MNAKLVSKVALLACAAVTAASCRTASSTRSGLKDEGVADSVGQEGACVAALPTLATYDWVEDTGREELGKVFQACLGEYIRINTVNPPGNEAAAATFLGKMFNAMGVPYRIVEVPGDAGGGPRTNLIAGWPGLDKGRGIILMNHMDVVHAHEDEWRKIQGATDVPFSGAVTEFDGEWVMVGRGAIDMKNIGLMQALTLGLLKAKNVTPEVPVYFVATADEENGSVGIRGLLAEAKAGGKAPELIDPYVVLNEGGFGIRGALGTASTIHAIGAEERGGAWLELKGSDMLASIKALAALDLLPTQKDVKAALEKHKAAADAAGCKLVSAETRETKANVVAARATVRLSCANDLSDAVLEDAFDPTPLWEKRKSEWRAAGSATPVTVKVTRPASGIIALELSTATSGHGSSFAGISALDSLAYGLQVIGAIQPLASVSLPAAFNYQITPASRKLLATAAKNHDLFGGIVPAANNIEMFLDKIDTLLGQRAFAAVATRFGIDKLFRTACTWTGFSGDELGGKATIDCRMIDLTQASEGAGSHPEKFIAVVKQHLAQQSLQGVDIKLLTGWNFTKSPIDGKIYAAIAESLEKGFAGSIATPFMIPGGTDSTYLRDPGPLGLPGLKGVPAYGVTPAVVTVDVVSTFHGANERFPLSMLAPSVRTYVKMVTKLATVVSTN